MRVPPRVVRRLLLPVSMAVLVVVAALLALVAVVGVVLWPFTPRRRVLRLALFGLAYVGMEVAVVARAGVAWSGRALRSLGGGFDTARWDTYHRALLDWALGAVLGAARRSFGFRVEVQDDAVVDLFAAEPPVLVLARHGGPGDSFALVHLLLSRYGRGVRIVLKDVLQLDPAVDLLLNRLGCCFLATGAGSTDELTDRVRQAAEAMGPREALLLFPEGGNWTPVRRHRAIRRLREARRHRAARTAELMEHVLPPRPAGVLACLEARPDVPVVIAAHTGFDHVVGAAEAWRALPIPTDHAMTVRLWPAIPVPATEDARVAWLTTEWAIVDEWIDAHR